MRVRRAEVCGSGLFEGETKAGGSVSQENSLPGLRSLLFCSCIFLSCGLFYFLPRFIYLTSPLAFRYEFVPGTVSSSLFCLCPHLSLPCFFPLFVYFPVWVPPSLPSSAVYLCVSLCVSPFLGLWLSLRTAPAAGVSLSPTRTPTASASPLVDFPGSPAPHLRPSSLPGASDSSLENGADTPIPRTPRRVAAAGGPRSRAAGPGEGAGRKGTSPGPGGLRWGVRVREAPLLAPPASARPAPVSIKSPAPPPSGSLAAALARSPGFPADLPSASPWISAPFTR